MSKEEKKGWVGSILIHVVIALVLFLLRVEETRTEPEFLEVSWGKLSHVPINTAPSSPNSSAAEPVKKKELVQRVPVELPERTPGFDDQDPPLPLSRKSPVEEQYNPSGTRRTESAQGTKEAGTGLGNEDRNLAANGIGESGKTPGPSLTGGEGTDVGKSVAYSMQWGDGGTRRLLVGDLPVYPEGVNVETQIRIEAVVMPGGKVRSMRPVQKGNIRLEQAAMAEVREWVFEPLASRVRQVDQVCLITFNFVLR